MSPLKKIVRQAYYLDTTLDKLIQFPSYSSLLLRAIIASCSVFIFLYTLNPKELFITNANIKQTQVYLIFAFTTAIIHIAIWLIASLIYKKKEARWTAFKSVFLKCFIGFTILCCLYLNAHYLGLGVDLAFFIKWGLIVAPSFAIALMFYEINHSPTSSITERKSTPISVAPIFKLSDTTNFLYAITCKKASSLDSNIISLSNGIFLHFDDEEVQLHNTTLSNFLLVNNNFESLVRCHDSYIINLDKVAQFDAEQGLVIIGNTSIPISKKGGNGINNIAEISEKIQSYKPNK